MTMYTNMWGVDDGVVKPHLIQNKDSVVFPVRGNLRFSGDAVVTDDPNTDATVVTVPAGRQGEQGPQGATGPMPTLEAEAQELVETAPPTATVVQTPDGYKVVFGIPQGATGPQGAAGTIAIGATSTLPAGSPATVTNTGTNTDSVFSFGIPQGIQGEQGIQGVQGPKGDKGDPGNDGLGSVSVGTTTTLTAGSPATVTNSGSAQIAVLNFGIPQGPQGTPGTDGAKGDTGTVFTPSITPQGLLTWTNDAGLPNPAPVQLDLTARWALRP